MRRKEALTNAETWGESFHKRRKDGKKSLKKKPLQRECVGRTKKRKGAWGLAAS